MSGRRRLRSSPDAPWADGAEGCWKRPDTTAETFIDGWVRTGDLAQLDEDRFLYIVDRAKDVVIRGGENIHSIEVENALQGHPGIVEAALIGIPHLTLGEVPADVARLAPRAAITEGELQAWVGNGSPRSRCRRRYVSYTSRCRATPRERSSSASWARFSRHDKQRPIRHR